MRQSSLSTITLVATLALLATSTVAQEDQTLSRGFDPNEVFNVGDIDSINLYTGALTVTLAIGQTYPVNSGLSYGLTLVHNSLPWDLDEISQDPPDPDLATVPVPSATSNAAFGWSLHLGMLFPPNSGPENKENRWMYVAPDSSRHHFHEDLYIAFPDNAPDVLYTRDSTYMRMKLVGSAREIEMRDGTIHRFTDHDPSSGEDWRLDQIHDRFNSQLNIAYVDTATTQDWTLTDSHGRTHTINFIKDFAGDPAWWVSQVSLEAFNGQTAVYTFTHDKTSLPKSYRNTSVTVPPTATIAVPLLTEIDLPDGTSYDFTDLGGQPRYKLTTGGIPGAILGMRLRTLGHLEWDYAAWDLPQNFSAVWADDSDDFGVVERRDLDADRNVLGTWKYTNEMVLEDVGPGDIRPRETMTYVSYPTGDCTEHFYRSDQNEQTTIGLPFSKLQAKSGPFFLSTQVWTTLGPGTGVATFTCSGTKLRSSYVIYEGGVADNARVRDSRTIYHDDGGRQADTLSSDFDGLGHYRTVATDGTFDAGNVRSMFTDWNKARGTHPSSFITLPATDPWLIETFEKKNVTEGGVTASETFCFDDASGFLKRRRTLNGASPAAEDLIADFEAGASGNVKFERYYGGDNSSVPTTADLCALTFTGNPEYEIRHFYSDGTLRKSRYHDIPTTDAILRFLDRTIDPSTGLVASSKDASDLVTTFTYDLLGRLTREQPQAGHGARVDFTYVNATSTNNARVEIHRQPNGGGADLAEERVIFDDLGRVFQERRRLPSGTLNTRETLYNDRGWKASISEVETGTPTNKTEFLEYDPFGRPGRIRPADGATHDVVVSYSGVRSVQRTVMIANTSGSEVASTTAEVFDRQGRLYQVTEPSGAAGANVTTTYGYDVGNRLASVSTTDTVTQNRLFTYDLRGLLVSEQHPEKGASGNGTVTYSQYDARGNVGKKVDGSADLRFTYDDAERLTRVDENVGGLRVLKEFTYADMASLPVLSRGKLVEATRHNYLLAFINQDLQITEVFTYAEVGGRVSKRETQRTDVGPITTPRTTWFETEFEWTDLGDVKTVDYPTCVIPTECTPGNPSNQPPRAQSYGYTQGFLTSVPGFADSISYHPNEMLASIDHSNGVTSEMDQDPNAMRRPARIKTTGVVSAANFDTGLYSYDGAGNVSAIGSDSFAYDGVSRLVSGTGMQGTVPETSAYDAFGNRTSAMTGPVGVRVIPVDAATNRALSTPNRMIAYDSRGNQTEWGAATYTFDAFNQMILQDDTDSGANLSYVYTADDERILTIENTQPSETWTIRDLDGLVLRKLHRVGTSPTWQNDTIHRQGQVLATDRSVIGIHHAHLDHLGTIRLWTTPSSPNPTVFSRHDYTAFGEEIVDTLDNQDHRYTSHERDILRSGGCSGTEVVDGEILSTGQVREGCDELTSSNTTVTSTDEVRFRAGDLITLGEDFSVSDNATFVAEIDGGLNSDLQDLDYMHARYCSPLTGRFLAVDPLSADKRRPQTFNRYAYALNNPLKWVDPTGEVVNLANLTEEQREELLRRLEDFTGIVFAISDKNELEIQKVKEDSSDAALDLFSAAIGSAETITVLGAEGSRVRFGRGNTATNEVTLDFMDFTKIDFGQVDPATFSLGAVLAHELAHVSLGLVDPPARDRDSTTGGTVDFVNRIRAERGLPTRGPAYGGDRGLFNRIRINFQNVNPKNLEKRYFVRARTFPR